MVPATIATNHATTFLKVPLSHPASKQSPMMIPITLEALMSHAEIAGHEGDDTSITTGTRKSAVANKKTPMREDTNSKMSNDLISVI